MKVHWAIICQNSIIDRSSNNVSLFNIIEEIHVAAQPIEDPLIQEPLPGMIPSLFQFVILFARSDDNSPEKTRGRLRITRPDSTEASSQEFEVDLTKFLRNRVTLALAGLPIIGEGEYSLVVEGMNQPSEWSHLFTLPLRVIFQAQNTA